MVRFRNGVSLGQSDEGDKRNNLRPAHEEN
jgi:hypothetical protein